MEIALKVFLGLIVVIVFHIVMFVIYKIFSILINEWEDRQSGKRD